MPSPFPGMNPYLENEGNWQDFHAFFITELKRQLVPLVGPKYFVKLEARLYFHELSVKERFLVGRGDVDISTKHPSGERGSVGVMAAPILVPVPAVDVEKLFCVEIRDQNFHRLVTVIELLSPSNKFSGPDRESYLGKRKSLVCGSVNFVEIDLLRAGPRMPIPKMPLCDYCVFIRRVADGPLAGLWPLSLREPLPTIRIPLNSPDEDLSINLKKVLDKVYDDGGYGPFIYQYPITPALSKADADWAKQFVPPEESIAR